MPNAPMLFGMVAFFLFSSGTVIAQSQRPDPTPLKTSHPPQTAADNSQQKTAADKHGTEQSPVVVKVLPTPKSEEESANEASEKKKKTATERWLVILTACLVCVGTIQIFVFGWQARRLRQTVDIMKDTAERQLRAYVHVTERQISAALNREIIHPITPIKAGFQPASILTIKNTGATPAYEVVMSGGITLAPWPLDPSVLPPLDFLDSGARESIGPGDIRYKYEIPTMDSRTLNTEDINGLRNGSLAIFVFGEVRYKDVFGKGRFTQYRFFIGGSRGVPDMALAGHDGGNEAN